MDEVITERDVLTDVLSLYKDFPCLWDTSHSQYCNRDARNQAYEALRSVYAKFEKGVSVEDMKKKIDNMRSTYRREKNKIEKSKSSGAGTDNIYTPSLWYYPYLTFLNEKQKPAVIGIDNIDDDEASECDSKASGKRKRNSQSSELLKNQMSLVEATKSLLNNTERNSADAFGQSIGVQLKELQDSQRWLAEKLMGEILYYARLGELNRNTSIDLNMSNYRNCLVNFPSPPTPPVTYSPYSRVKLSHSLTRLNSQQHHIQSLSPRHHNKSPSPTYNIQSPSPRHHNKSLHSLSHLPLHQHHTQSPHSSSTQHPILSPSPQRHIRSPSPQYHIRSPSPQYHIRSPSPQHHIQSPNPLPHSPSPQHRIESPHLPSHSQSSDISYCVNNEQLIFEQDQTNHSVNVVRGQGSKLKVYRNLKNRK